MNKTISIIGPTATGKTDTALGMSNYLIKNKLIIGVDIISADSRQVYKGLEIITGADIPIGFKKHSIGKNSPKSSNHKYPFYKKNNISLYGVSIITPDEEWSVTHFRDFAQTIINESHENNRLPIIVGGTGLYHQQLFNNDTQLMVKPDLDFRKKADNLSLQELQNWLEKINAEKLDSMNNSDKNNPRRLIRAIEISSYLKNGQKNKNTTKNPSDISDISKEVNRKNNHFSLYLSNTLKNILKSINKRVEVRFNNGAIDEVKNLYKKYSHDLCTEQTNSPAFSATGVKEIHDLLEKNISQDEALTKWSLREFQYAKRQLTWWRKNS